MNMKYMLEEILPDWNIHADFDSGSDCYELENWSPCGENIVFAIYGDNFHDLAKDAWEVWQDFDAEEHAADILLAKREGDVNVRRFYAAAPNSLKELLEDAEAIDRMYEQVYNALSAAAK